MDILKNIFSFFRNFFNKKEPVKVIEENKSIMDTNEKKDFVETIKVDKGNLNNISNNEGSCSSSSSKKINKNIIKIPINPGDGLGIQKKISY